jgi:hypothetical protein
VGLREPPGSCPWRLRGESTTSQLGITRRTLPFEKSLHPVDGTPTRAIPGMEISLVFALITATCRAIELKFGAPESRICLVGGGICPPSSILGSSSGEEDELWAVDG